MASPGLLGPSRAAQQLPVAATARQPARLPTAATVLQSPTSASACRSPTMFANSPMGSSVTASAASPVARTLSTSGTSAVATAAPGRAPAANALPVAAQYRVGDAVEARWGKSETWFAATIAGVNPDGTFTVDWEDGNTHGRTKRAEDLRRRGTVGPSSPSAGAPMLPAGATERGTSVLANAARSPTASASSPTYLAAKGASVGAAAEPRPAVAAEAASAPPLAVAARVRAAAAEAQTAAAAAASSQPRAAEVSHSAAAPRPAAAASSSTTAASPTAAAPLLQPRATAAPAAAAVAPAAAAAEPAGECAARLPAGARISPEAPQKAQPSEAPAELPMEAAAAPLEPEDEAAEGERPKPRDDVKCFMVERADGSTCVVVQRSSDGKRWRFEKTSVDFELNCDAESLSAWLDGISNQQFPGLLTLLAAEVGERGAQLKDAEKDRDALRGTEDYDFFGLDGAGCTDKDIERAYRKKSTQLHPDKGGDEKAFSEMRKKYEQLKELRGEGKRKEGGGGAIKWDPNSRESMMKAHSDLREQIIWITKHMVEVTAQVEELKQRQLVRRTLMWAPHSESCRSDAASAGDAAYISSNLQAASC